MKDETKPLNALGPPAGGEIIEEESEFVSVDDATGDELLALIVAEHAARAAEARAERPTRIDGVIVGRLSSVGEGGVVVVSHLHAASPEGDKGRAFVPLSAGDVGREVALLFEGGSPDRPIVMGLMHVDAKPIPLAAVGRDLHADGERLEFNAEKEIVLRCGDASITLTRAGKILIRGAYLLARSTGVNRIQGGSVEIN